MSASPLVMTRSSTLVITDPFGIPAFSAGPPAVTSTTVAPLRGVLRRNLDPDDGLGGLAGLDQLVRDAPGLVDRDREAESDRAALLARTGAAECSRWPC